jgi:adenylylsulfate kinase
MRTIRLRRDEATMPALILVTGLPSSGKTTLSSIVARKLRRKGYCIVHLDAYTARRCIGAGDTDFDEETVGRVLRCLTIIVNSLLENNVHVILSGVFPTRAERRTIIESTGNARHYTVYLKCPPEKCMLRDNKGLYKRFLSGMIKRLPGLNPPYEEPSNPDLVIETWRLPLEGSARILQEHVEKWIRGDQTLRKTLN